MKSILASDIQYLIESGYDLNESPVSVIEDSNAIGVIISIAEFSRLKKAAGEIPLAESMVSVDAQDPIEALSDIKGRIDLVIEMMSVESSQ